MESGGFTDDTARNKLETCDGLRAPWTKIENTQKCGMVGNPTILLIGLRTAISQMSFCSEGQVTVLSIRAIDTDAAPPLWARAITQPGTHRFTYWANHGPHSVDTFGRSNVTTMARVLGDINSEMVLLGTASTSYWVLGRGGGKEEAAPAMPCMRCMVLWEHDSTRKCEDREESRGSCAACRQGP